MSIADLAFGIIHHHAPMSEVKLREIWTSFEILPDAVLHRREWPGSNKS